VDVRRDHRARLRRRIVLPSLRGPSQQDRFFGWFAAAFWLLGLSWAIHLATGGPTEESPYIYLVRAAAYLVIIVGIVDRNRKPRVE